MEWTSTKRIAVITWAIGGAWVLALSWALGTLSDPGFVTLWLPLLLVALTGAAYWWVPGNRWAEIAVGQALLLVVTVFVLTGLADGFGWLSLLFAIVYGLALFVLWMGPVGVIHSFLHQGTHTIFDNTPAEGSAEDAPSAALSDGERQ